MLYWLLSACSLAYHNAGMKTRYVLYLILLFCLLCYLFHRWVIVNKDPSRAGTSVLQINRAAGYDSTATVLRLTAPGPDPLSATQGITLGGVSYGLGGVANGKEVVESVSAVSYKGETTISVYMPPGSAALVRLAARS